MISHIPSHLITSPWWWNSKNRHVPHRCPHLRPIAAQAPKKRNSRSFSEMLGAMDICNSESIGRSGFDVALMFGKKTSNSKILISIKTLKNPCGTPQKIIKPPVKSKNILGVLHFQTGCLGRWRKCQDGCGNMWNRRVGVGDHKKNPRAVKRKQTVEG